MTLPIWLILGPSGAGKSCFGERLKATERWTHLEVDLYPLDGIDQLDLRGEWNEFYTRGSCRPFIDAVQERAKAEDSAGCALTVPSNLCWRFNVLQRQNEQAPSSFICMARKPSVSGSFSNARKRSGPLGHDHWRNFRTA